MIWPFQYGKISIYICYDLYDDDMINLYITIDFRFNPLRFSYTLLFFQYRFTGSLGGTLILLGQVADAIASPFVGYESDKSANMWLCRTYGRRKMWHLVGVLMNTISVPLVYNHCFGCDNAPEWSQFIYYAVLVIIFQAGWAATQVSHVSLITDLTNDTNERIALNSYR